MDPPVLLERMINDGVLSVSDGGDEVMLTEPFLSTVAGYREEFASEDALATDAESIGVRASVTTEDDWADWRGFVAFYRALRESGLRDPSVITRMVLVLQSLEHSPSELGAIPAYFLPVAGEQMYASAQLALPTIVFVWRDQCDPCEVMRTNIDEAAREPVDGVLQLAVNGSTCPVLLAETFDVRGAPTLLFIRGGQVEARLVGPSAPNVIRNEIDMIAPEA